VLADLAAADAAAVLEGTRRALLDTLRRKINRVLVLEFNAARLRGQLTAGDPAGRWAQFVDRASGPGFWAEMAGPYPTLVHRLRAVTDHRCAAAAELAQRCAADRADLAGLFGADPGELLAVEVGAGDSHRGGRTVTRLRWAGVTMLYKPRSMRVDVELARLLAVLTADDDPATRIQVPRALLRAGYGWAEHVAHRYCVDDAETGTFYRNLGHWLAVMRLVSGTDLHAENLIACGPVPVVVDCESVFTPRPPHPATGAGRATDLVAEQLTGTVLRTGLLPGRGAGLGWRGVDGSGMGMLPDQQPQLGLPELVGVGTDEARIALVPRSFPVNENLPGPRPDLGRHWHRVIEGFEVMAARIAALDRAGELAPLLAGFADCEVRVVVRDSEAYAELGRMLWHPAGLHDQPAAEARARALLARHSMNTRGPAGAEVHAAEVADLLVGDIPIFTTTPAEGWLHTPAGTHCGARVDQIGLAVRRWREADLTLERRVTHAALVSAYLNQGSAPDLHRMATPTPDRRTLDGADLDLRRRRLAAGMLTELIGEAVTCQDGTATWFAPVLGRSGWQTTPLTPDLYGGTLGVAVLLAGYRQEVAAGRADPVQGIDRVLAGTLRTARLTQRWWAEQATHTRRRPDPTGGFIGLGSQLWCWLTLDRLGADGVEDALFLAAQVPAAIAASEGPDMTVGTAGVIVPLLALADRTSDPRWVDVAVTAAEQLTASVRRTEAGQASWAVANWPDGVGGFAHGSTGIGWALARLGLHTGRSAYLELATDACRYERTWYDEALAGWRDPRSPTEVVAAWCHGAVGVGLAARDLLARGLPDEGYAELLSLAVPSAARDGLGYTHTLCHGDAGAWELLAGGNGDRAAAGPSTVDAALLTSLETYGVTTGLAREVYSPSMLSGSGGPAYTLLRMHPDCPLSSVLLLGD